VQVCLFPWLAACQIWIWSASLTNPVITMCFHFSLCGIGLLILNCATEPSCPSAFKLIWSLFSVLTLSSWWVLESPELPLHKRGAWSALTAQEQHHSSRRRQQWWTRQSAHTHHATV
jgi:hypothetical protein